MANRGLFLKVYFKDTVCLAACVLKTSSGQTGPATFLLDMLGVYLIEIARLIVTRKERNLFRCLERGVPVA